MDSDPVVVGVMLTEHVADALVPARLQASPGVKVTVPVGVVGLVAVSVTIAVQLVAWLTTTVDGVQLTDVEVAFGEAGIGKFASSVTFVDPGVDVPDPWH